MIRRRLTGLLAAAGIAVLLIGLPAVLLAVGYGTLPRIASWTDLVDLLGRRDDGTLALLILKVAGWITWAILALSILLEVIALARGIRPRALPGLHLPQAAARQLVAAAAALFVVLPSSTPLGYPPPITHSTAVTATIEPAAPAAARVTADALKATIKKDAGLSTRPHVVLRGESLWSIAENELGNGRRYADIAALNTDLLQGKGDGFLRPGWVLQLPVSEPGSAESEPSAQTADTTYTVAQGDTLSGIARTHLGDETAYPRIVEASHAITQPGGRHLTNPDVIDVGWTLNVPDATAGVGTATTPVAPAPETGPVPSSLGREVPAAEATESASASVPAAPPSALPAPAPSAPAESGAPSTAPTASVSSPESAANQGVHADQPDDISVAPAWILAGLVGAGTILGGSLTLALRRRRAAQVRARRPGRMVATPPPALAPVEKTLATAGVNATATVEFLDQALRRLAATQGRARRPMPLLAAAELGDTHLALHLSAACDLVAPWTPAPDQFHWHLRTDVDLDDVGPLDAAVPAPYPQLVTIGADDDGHLWLLNLEEAAVVQLSGDPEYARDFARYVAAEVAVNPWSRDVMVELVGIAAEAVALNPIRVRHHATAEVAAGVLTDTVNMIDRANAANLDVATGRATLLDDDLWDSRLLLLDTSLRTPVSDQLMRLLRDHPRRTGTAILLVGDNDEGAQGEVIRLTAEGRLMMPGVGLDLVAVGLTADEAAGCAAVFAQADDHADVDMPVHPEPAEGWRAHSNQAGQLRAELVQARDVRPIEPAASVLPEPDATYLAVAATTVEDLATMAPQVPVRIRHEVEKDDPTLDDDVRTWFDPHCDLPKLMLLGPLTVRVSPTGNPTTAANRKPYLSELLAYLATRPYGATTEEVAEAMRITTDRVRKDILTLRTWLGPNPRTGQPHIPDSRHTAAARARGKGAYEVEGLLVDADLFRRLRVRGESRGPVGLEDLRTALTLVTGTPFAQLRVDGGAWLTDGDRLDQILQCAIVDVAHLVTTASLQHGDLAEAQAAAELAARVAPDEETPQLDLAAVLEVQGHHQAAERLLRDRVCNRCDDEDGAPADLPERTNQIINNQQWLTRQGTRASA